MRNNCFKKVLVTLCLIVASSSVLAVPQTINYQGYITDSSGTPVNTTVDITFRIYDVDTGGTDIWRETDAVVISDGKFTTPLGDGTAFPTALFDNASLYLGIEIETDGEMSPRKPLLTAPFAFKADDANTLEGMSASEFIGTSGGQSIAGDVTINGEVYASDLTVDGNTNVIDLIMSGGGALVFQDGSFQTTNSVNSILAADGAGSTLDADLIDGMQATEIIDAASDEVRTPISQADLPMTIGTSGSYYFSENLSHTSSTTDAIHVDVDNVSIDMMGFTLTGPGSTTGSANTGIEISNQKNITIRNGTVSEFGYRGIWGSLGSHVRVVEVSVIDNGDAGMYLWNNSQVWGCLANGNGDEGIYTYTASVLINNTASFNTGTGITGRYGSTLMNNTANSNQGFAGILGGESSAMTNNTSYSHQGEYGLYGGFGATVVGNSVYANQRWGLGSNGYSLIKENTVWNNNLSNTASEGGMLVNRNSRVVGNTVGDNNGYGIYLRTNSFVPGTDSIIDGNHITDSTVGIYFEAIGNAYRNNTFAGNTLATDGATATDGGGNLSF